MVFNTAYLNKLYFSLVTRKAEILSLGTLQKSKLSQKFELILLLHWKTQINKYWERTKLKRCGERQFEKSNF